MLPEGSFGHLIFSFVGGLGLVLVGLKFLSESFQCLFGRSIQWFINSISKNLLATLCAGFGVSFLVQSGVSTSIMSISYASSGLFSYAQLCSFLMGANLGTTFTPFIFLVDANSVGLYLLGVGAFPMLFSSNETISALAKVFFGLGVLLFGFQFLDQGIHEPLIMRGYIDQFFGALGWSPKVYFTGLILIFVLASLFIRSSVALVALVMILVYRDVLPDVGGVIAVLGVNLGTSIPAVVASHKSPLLAKKGALFNLVSQSLVISLISFFFIEYWSFVADTTQFMDSFLFSGSLYGSKSFFMIPFSHLLFNVVLILFAAIFFVPIQYVVSKLVGKAEKKEMQRLQFLGSRTLVSPSLALEQALLEIKKLAAMVESIFQMTHDQVFSPDLQAESKVVKYEQITDNIKEELDQFLSHVMELNLSEKQGIQIRGYIHLTDELEKIADNCKEIYELGVKIQKSSPGSVSEIQSLLKKYFYEVHSFYEKIFSVLSGAVEIQWNSEKVESFIDRLEDLREDLLEKVMESNIERPVKINTIDIVQNLGMIGVSSKKIVESGFLVD